MMSKCLVVLIAVVAGISAYKYDQDSVSYAKPEQSTSNTYKYCYQPSQISEKNERVVTASPAKSSSQSQNQNVAYVRSGINAAPITRNLIARGKYPVALQSSGPAPDKKIPVVTSHLRAPVQEKPTVRLQAKIPAPKTIAHTCTCYKTILKPRVQQHLISVPTIQRYIETFHRPVVENIHYEAYPVRCMEATEGEEKEKTQTFQVQPVDISAISGAQTHDEKNSGVQTLEIPRSFEMPKTQQEKPQMIEIPRCFEMPKPEQEKTQVIEIPRCFETPKNQQEKPQMIEIPRCFEMPKPQQEKSQMIEIPRCFEMPKTQQEKTQVFEIPRYFEMPKTQQEKTQVIEIPRIQFAEEQKPQTIEIPRVQYIQSKKPQTVQIELPRVQFVESQKSEGFEFPQTQAFDNKKPQFVEILNAQLLDNCNINQQQNNNNNNNKAENIQMPRVEFLPTQKLQTMEIPRIQMEEPPKVQTVEIPLGGAPYTYQLKH